MHTHAHILREPVKRSTKITGCQAVFTVFSIPGGPSSLGPLCLSSSLLHKHISFLFFRPSKTRQLGLFFARLTVLQKGSVCYWNINCKLMSIKEQSVKRSVFLICFVRRHSLISRLSDSQLDNEPCFELPSFIA